MFRIDKSNIQNGDRLAEEVLLFSSKRRKGIQGKR